MSEKNMCCLFRSQNPASYTAETRAIRLHGHATSIRLESAFWDILQEIATKEQMSVARFIGVLNDEVLAHQGEVANLASFLRVTCTHYLRHQDLHAAQVAERLARAPFPDPGKIAVVA
jgi:predicted DNA-binding ribbon-helix-helix protein